MNQRPHLHILLPHHHPTHCWGHKWTTSSPKPILSSSVAEVFFLILLSGSFCGKPSKENLESDVCPTPTPTHHLRLLLTDPSLCTARSQHCVPKSRHMDSRGSGEGEEGKTLFMPLSWHQKSPMEDPLYPTSYRDHFQYGVASYRLLLHVQLRCANTKRGTFHMCWVAWSYWWWYWVGIMGTQVPSLPSITEVLRVIWD